MRTLPAVTALRDAYPRAHLAWLVEPASAGVLEGQPWIDEVIVFPRDRLRDSLQRLRGLTLLRHAMGFLRGLRRERFDLVVDFHSIFKSGLLSLASGARLRVAYARPYGRELAWLFANARARLTPVHTSRFDRNAGLVRFLACEQGSPRAPLRIDPAGVERVRQKLGPGAAPVALHPGTSASTPHKRYTTEGYARVAHSLAKDGLRVIVTHGPAPAERRLAEQVVERAAGGAELAPATPSLLDLATLLACCRLYVGSDTGPMHVASLVGTPVVQLLGPTDPLENRPWPGTPSRSVRVEIGCNPCRRGCSAATCMRVIPPERVVEAARALLATPASRVIESAAPGGR